MNFFEGLGIFIVALVVFLILSFLIGTVFTYDNAAWISGSVIYALTVVGLIYIARCGGSL